MPGVQSGTSHTVGPSAAEGGAATSDPAAITPATAAARNLTWLLSHMREGCSSFRRRLPQPRVILWLPLAGNERQGGRHVAAEAPIGVTRRGRLDRGRGSRRRRGAVAGLRGAGAR